MSPKTTTPETPKHRDKSLSYNPSELRYRKITQ